MADPTIVLVHGAFADASGFRGLYDELLGEDVTVVAPPNPLRGLSGGDDQYLKAVVDEIGGPGLLGGHSYGGVGVPAGGAGGHRGGPRLHPPVSPAHGARPLPPHVPLPPPRGRPSHHVTDHPP